MSGESVQQESTKVRLDSTNTSFSELLAFNCPICRRSVSDNHRAIECDVCYAWYHLRCTPLSLKEYNHISVTADLWFCTRCRHDIFPFTSITKSELCSMSFNSNTACKCTSKICMSRLDSLPCLDFAIQMNNSHILNDADPDSNIENKNNFKYYTTHDFHNRLQDFNDSSFSVIHCNVRSLQKNFDNLHQMLSELSLKFQLIAVSETKLYHQHEGKSKTKTKTKTSIPGYKFKSQPSLSQAGGVGFYINENLSFTIREDLNVVNDSFETFWIEIERPNQNNLVCSVVYRHPNSDLTYFIESFFSTISSIHHTKKQCLIMGDFNINLLNCDSHPLTDQFLSTFASFFYKPYITAPTRITNHSATLIDNIFFNSLEYSTYSGNIIYDVSDHLPNFLIINKLSTVLKNQQVYKRDYSNFSETRLINEFKTLDWNEVLPPEATAEELFDAFYTKSTSIINKVAPLKLLSKKEKKILI